MVTGASAQVGAGTLKVTSNDTLAGVSTVNVGTSTGSRTNSGAEVASGHVEVAPAAVGVPPAQPGQHRVGTDRNGAAEAFDGGKRLTAGQGRFARGDEQPVAALPGGRPGGEGTADRGDREHAHQDKCTFHGDLS